MKNLAKIINNVVTDVFVFSDEDFAKGIAHCKNIINDVSSDSIYIESNSAGVDWLYDSNSGTVYPPQPNASWTLDSNFEWQPPITKPIAGENVIFVSWKEVNYRWEALENPSRTPLFWNTTTSTWDVIS
tara:strand:- start:1220 stop:1606 length:387 start_codon:yes stop_codon:yes gene_type:complete